MNKSSYTMELVAICMLLACAFGCGRSVRVLSVFPETATPGMVVRVTTDKAAFQPERPARIEMGGQTATIQQVVSLTEADAFVPNLLPGQTQVQVHVPGKKSGPPGQLTILPAPCLQLTLVFQNDSVSLVRAQPRAGEVSRAAEPGQRRLSFDVLNAQEGLVFTGSAVHPTRGRHEIYDEPQPGEHIIRSAPSGQRAVFTIKIPNILGELSTIKFYDVPADADLNTPAWREKRTFLNEIKLNQ